MIREIQEGRRCGPFFTLKEHGHEGAQQVHCRGDLRAIDAGDVADAVAYGAIADLIVGLNISEKSMLRQEPRGLAVITSSIAGVDSVINEIMFKSFGQLG